MKHRAVVKCSILVGLACCLALPVLAINRGHVLDGTVTDTAGKPVVRAKVILSGGTYHQGPGGSMVGDQGSQAAGDWEQKEIASAWTDEQGKYLLIDIPAGSWTLTVIKSGYSRQPRTVDMQATNYSNFHENITIAGKDGSDQRAALYLPEGVEVKSKALKAWTKAQEAILAKNHDLAIQQLEKAIEADPSFARAHADLGAEYLRRQDTAKAEEYYRKALELNPGDPVPMINLAGLLIRAEKSAEAIPLLEKAIEVDPDLARAHLYLGQAYMTQKNFAEAVPPLTQAGALDAEECSAAFGLLGTAEAAQGHYREARDAYQRFVDLSPDDPRVPQLKETIKKLDEQIPAEEPAPAAAAEAPAEAPAPAN